MQLCLMAMLDPQRRGSSALIPLILGATQEINIYPFAGGFHRSCTRTLID